MPFDTGFLPGGAVPFEPVFNGWGQPANVVIVDYDSSIMLPADWVSPGIELAAEQPYDSIIIGTYRAIVVINTVAGGGAISAELAQALAQFKLRMWVSNTSLSGGWQLPFSCVTTFSVGTDGYPVVTMTGDLVYPLRFTDDAAPDAYFYTTLAAGAWGLADIGTLIRPVLFSAWLGLDNAG